MVIGKELVRVKIGKSAEFINIFDISDMAGVCLAVSDPRINSFIVLPVVKARQKHITAAK